MTLQPRAVLVHRRSEYDEIIRRHGTRQAAEFFLETRGRKLTDLADRHELLLAARRRVVTAIPPEWRRAEVERNDLHRFSFAPEDIITVVGQDGLVANVAKYLQDQPVIGINPEPARNPGVLVPNRPEEAAVVFEAALRPTGTLQRRTMVTATADDGQTIHALNEIYYGHRSHQSATYRIELSDGSSERHSSSGVLIGTGTGATGWLRSAWQQSKSPLRLPGAEDPQLCWFVREAWPSRATGTDLTEGLLSAGDGLRLHSEHDELVCFGDGIESDRLQLGWGQTVTVTVADRPLYLVTNP